MECTHHARIHKFSAKDTHPLYVADHVTGLVYKVVKSVRVIETLHLRLIFNTDVDVEIKNLLLADVGAYPIGRNLKDVGRMKVFKDGKQLAYDYEKHHLRWLDTLSVDE